SSGLDVWTKELDLADAAFSQCLDHNVYRIGGAGRARQIAEAVSDRAQTDTVHDGVDSCQQRHRCGQFHKISSSHVSSRRQYNVNANNVSPAAARMCWWPHAIYVSGAF